MLKPRYADKVKEQLHYRKGRETHYYNKGAKELPTLQEGDVVRVRPKGNEKSWKKAIVEGQVDIRSYNRIPPKQTTFEDKQGTFRQRVVSVTKNRE